MVFTVQNDLGTVEGANAYVSVSEADAYFADRGNAVWGDEELEEAKKEIAIIQATDYLDHAFEYRGMPLNEVQSTQWPRQGIYDALGNEIKGITEAIKRACYEYALRSLSSELLPDPVYSEDWKEVLSKRQKVDVIETEFTYGSGVRITRSYPKADMYIQSLIVSSNRVFRA